MSWRNRVDRNEHNQDHPPFEVLLRTHRRRAGLSQQALAELATVSARTIRDLESGRTRARARTVQLLADGLGLQGLSRQTFLAAASARSGSAADNTPEFSTDLPHSGDPLIGREHTVLALSNALKSSHPRAVCVVGLAGVGKSRTLLEVARRLHRQDGWPVLWVCATTPSSSTPAGRLTTEIRTQLHSDSPDLSYVCRLIGDHEALIVLDGLSLHTPTYSAALLEMLGRCAGLRIAITTRSLSTPHGFQPALIDPLPTTPIGVPAATLAELTAIPSVQLLSQRLQAIQPGWALTPDNVHAVVALCQRLDGLPVALETAAQQCTVVSLHELAALPARDLLWLSTPTATGKVSSLRDLIADTCALLDEAQLAHLHAVAALSAPATVTEIADRLKISGARLVSMLMIFLRLGLIRRHSDHLVSRFEVLNLVRAFLRSRRSGPLPVAA